VELFGVSVTTLEEVFLRVGRDHTEADVAADERLQQATGGAITEGIRGKRREMAVEEYENGNINGFIYHYIT
jgi:hypothetical protein